MKSKHTFRSSGIMLVALALSVGACNDDDGADELIRQHNAELKAFYERRGRNLDEDAWSGPVARSASELTYTELRDFIVSRGFSLD